MTSSPVRLALNKAIRALRTISDDEIASLPLLDHTLILNALPDVAELAHLRKQLTNRLCQRLSTSWIQKNDLQEVFSVLAALWKYNPEYITGEYLGCALKRLIKAEVAVGGPYYSDGTTGIIANVHAATFIRLAAKPLPNMEHFFVNLIISRRLESTYLTSFGLAYLLAKASDTQELVQYVAGRWQQNEWQTAGQKAIAIGILKDHIPTLETEQAMIFVCKEQQRSGFWNGETLMKASEGQRCRPMTTALIAETLANYQDNLNKSPQQDLQRRQQTIKQRAEGLFREYADPLRSSALAMVAKVCRADTTFEITLLPYFFMQALKTPARLTRRQYIMLSLANVCAWAAYTIYDDLLDGEGAPMQLPAANIAMRTSLDCFRQALPKHDSFQSYVGTVFAKMDEANAWEVSHCRFTVQADKVTIAYLPRYGYRAMLAARSFGYVLAPVAVLVGGASGPRNKVDAITSGFKHYLIARQLNDDMHDWLRDIRSGQASYVVTAILRDMHIKSGVYDLPVLSPAMQKHFRLVTMPKVCRSMLWHLARSQQSFEKSHLLRPANAIYGLIEGLESSARQSLDKHAKALALMNTVGLS